MSIRVIKSLKIDLDGKDIIRKDLDVNSSLTDTRKKLSELIRFPFVFVDDEDNEINKELENNKNLCDILDGKNLIIKKEVKIRKILGKKISSKGKLDYYLYPQFKLTADQEDCSTNILVIGETGVGKSTWIHALLNYIQGIQIEENVRYKIFDQTELRKRYEKKYGKQFGEKQAGSSDTDEPDIYNIIPNDEYSPYENPIRIIDTAGFGDTRGKEYDEKIRDDIRKMFESSNIESLNAVCLIFKGTETRSHERTKDIFDKLFSLFGKDIRNNIIIIFTFANSSTDAMTAITTLKDKSSPFYQIMGDIEQIPHFFFNNIAYFSDERENYYNAFEQNTLSFSKFFNCIRILKRISLESTREVIRDRNQIRGSISNLTDRLNNIIKNTILSTQKQRHLSQKQKDMDAITPEDDVDIIEKTYEYYELEEETVNCSNGWYVLYCDKHEYVCHKNCRGQYEGWHSSEYGCDMIYTIGGNCAYCGHHWEDHTFRSSYKDKVQKKKNKK